MKKLMVLVALLISLAACGQASGNSNSSPNGSWKADNFTAIVSNNHIEIRLKGLKYWDGTLPAGTSVTSVASGKMQLSQSTTKDFSVGNKISFEFSIVGTTQTIKMKRA